MRVVLDTNILARSSYRLEGPAAEVLEQVTRRPHVLVLSEAIIEELGRVLNYPRLRQLHKMSDEKIGRFIATLQRAALILDPSDVVGPVIDDPDDLPVLAVAVAGQANVVCTRDRHFYQDKVREFCSEREIEIMDDVQLLARLRALDEESGLS